MRYRNGFFALLLSVIILFSLSSSALAAPGTRDGPSQPVRFEIPPTEITSPFATNLNGATQLGVHAPGVSLPPSIPLLVIVSEFIPSDGSVSVQPDDYTYSGYLRWPWSTFDAGTWSQMFFGTNESVKDYYSKISGNRFTFTPAEESDSQYNGCINDGVVFVQIKKNHPDYDKRIAPWLDSTIYPGESVYIGFSVKAAMEEAASCGYVNFSQFDKDHNGKITTDELIVYNVIAGYEDILEVPADAPKVYAHRYSISSATSTYDGNTGEYSEGAPANVGVNGAKLYLDNYMITGERFASARNYTDCNPPMYSIIAHELGHSLGLPDLYDTTNRNIPQPQVLSLSNMAYCYGSTYDPDHPDSSRLVPTALDAWSRAYLGLQTPQLARPGMRYALHSLKSASPYNIIEIPTSDPDEYYLLENRQYESYDKGLEITYLYDAVDRGERDYQPGVVIWHIRGDVVRNTLRNNTVNNDENNPGVMPVFLEGNNYKPFRVNKPEHAFTFNYSNSQYGRIVIESPSDRDMNVSFTLVSKDGSSGTSAAADSPCVSAPVSPLAPVPSPPATGDAPAALALYLLLCAAQLCVIALKRRRA